MTDDGITRDANGYAYDDYPASRLARAQKVLNEDWPYRDDKGRHARGIGDEPADAQHPITVRLVFEDDGEVFLPGTAVRWTRRPRDQAHVYAAVSDPRLPSFCVWVRAGDVTRR